MDARALDEGHLGRAHTRVEGPDKVTGRALYSSDRVGPETATAHAALVTSTIARAASPASTSKPPGGCRVSWGSSPTGISRARWRR